MAKGTIKTLIQQGKGFGFIKQDDGDDIFFHANSLRGASFEELSEGQSVEYAVSKGRKGLEATSVHPLGARPAAATGSHHRRFLNPYNFVRSLPEPGGGEQGGIPDSDMAAAFQEAGLSGEVLSEEEKAVSSLMGRCAPPTHDRYVGITGRITCKMKTVTPLFVSDSHGVKDEKHKSYRFFRANGKYAIPGASLRGMIRNLFEAATDSCMSLFEGRRLSYRFDTRKAPTLVPARVESDGDSWSLKILTGTVNSSNGHTADRLQPAAWIRRYCPIKPTSTYGNTSDTTYSARPRVNLNNRKHGEECWAVMGTTPARRNHPTSWFTFWDVEAIESTSRDRDEVAQQYPGKRIERGWLCITNQNIENKHDERFFFHSLERSDEPSIIDLDPTVRKDYNDLLEDYCKRHADAVKKRRDDGNEPEEIDGDDPAFSRFIVEDQREIRNGDLVYAALVGKGKKASAKFIVPVSVPRRAYEKSIADILASEQPHLQSCDSHNSKAHAISDLTLCPACRTFGWVRDEDPADPEAIVAYASRVRVSMGEFEGEPKKLSAPIPLAILSSPKPTTSAFYLLNNKEAPDFDIDYNTSGVRLRGRKFYRHHGTAQPGEYTKAGENSDQNRTVRDALDVDNVFHFTIDFENLAPAELGALLWAVRLEKGWVHRLGYAKPLGFGSLNVEEVKLQILNPNERFASLESSGWVRVDAQKWESECIDLFKNAMADRYGVAFEDLDNIQDLEALLGTSPKLPVHYPRPPLGNSTRPNPEGKQFEWFQGNREALPLATDDTEGFPYYRKNGSILE